VKSLPEGMPFFDLVRYSHLSRQFPVLLRRKKQCPWLSPGCAAARSLYTPGSLTVKVRLLSNLPSFPLGRMDESCVFPRRQIHPTRVAKSLLLPTPFFRSFPRLQSSGGWFGSLSRPAHPQAPRRLFVSCIHAGSTFISIDTSPPQQIFTLYPFDKFSLPPPVVFFIGIIGRLCYHP